MGLRQFMIGLGAIVLFSLACIIFMNTFIAENNPSSELIGDPWVNSTLASFEERASELEELGEDTKDLLAEDKPSAAYYFLIIPNAFYVLISFLVFIPKMIGTILVTVFLMFFGRGDSPYYIVMGVISAILTLTLVLFILKAIRTGETER